MMTMTTTTNYSANENEVYGCGCYCKRRKMQIHELMDTHSSLKAKKCSFDHRTHSGIKWELHDKILIYHQRQ